MATVAQVLSTPGDNLWTFELADGRGLRRAMEFMVPYIRNRKGWQKPPDVMYDGEWPMRQASLLFGGVSLEKPEYLALWSTLPADSSVDEVIRNFFIRQPALWIDTGATATPGKVRFGVPGSESVAGAGSGKREAGSGEHEARSYLLSIPCRTTAPVMVSAPMEIYSSRSLIERLNAIRRSRRAASAEISARSMAYNSSASAL